MLGFFGPGEVQHPLLLVLALVLALVLGAFWTLHASPVTPHPTRTRGSTPTASTRITTPLSIPTLGVGSLAPLPTLGTLTSLSTLLLKSLNPLLKSDTLGATLIDRLTTLDTLSLLLMCPSLWPLSHSWDSHKTQEHD